MKRTYEKPTVQKSLVRLQTVTATGKVTFPRIVIPDNGADE